MQINKQSKQEIIDAFVNAFEHGDQPKYLFGYNDVSRQIASKIKINGFILDNYSNFHLDEFEIITNIDKIPQDSLVISCITNSFINKAIHKLKNKNHFDFIDCLTFIDFSNLNLIHIPPIKDAKDLVKTNIDYFNSNLNIFFDQKSKDLYLSIINFRIKADISFMKEFTYDIDSQYFDEVVEFGESEVFIDGGGFDGFTTQNFISKCPNYKKIYYFEPNKSLLNQTEKLFENYSNISFNNIGLFDSKGVQRFDLNNGPTSSVSEFGEELINVDKLDSIVNEPVTFVKLDIEGAEMKALKGMKEIIETHKPKLAISVYHNASDLVEIPNYILTLNPSYKVYFRHYTEGWAESIMYFIP
jgi:FkbM family methyltransferase